PPELRPDHVAADLRALHRPRHESAIVEQPGWKVGVDGHRLELSAQSGESPRDPFAALRALCAAWWPNGGGEPTVHPCDDQAESALHTLHLG
ncbi:hypothetical protein NAB30_17560, partial [Proteus mirabilis]|nr:hypothetical protein [Proteus mirabilis]